MAFVGSCWMYLGEGTTHFRSSQVCRLRHYLPTSRSRKMTRTYSHPRGTPGQRMTAFQSFTSALMLRSWRTALQCFWLRVGTQTGGDPVLRSDVSGPMSRSVWRISNWLEAVAVWVGVHRVDRCNMTQRKTSEAVPITVDLAPLCVAPLGMPPSTRRRDMMVPLG
jgi:hypothetical protein